MNSSKCIQNIELRLDNKTSQILNEAEMALRSLKLNTSEPYQEKAIKDASLWVESIANLRMSGHNASLDELMRINILKPYYTNSRNERIKIETLRNCDAFSYAASQHGKEITPELLCELHALLLTGDKSDNTHSDYRTADKLIDTNKYYAFESAYKTPEAQNIPLLLDDLVAFCNKSTMPTIAQAAIAHAQFICIHPFNRANGKTARALNHLIFANRGITHNEIIPVSLPMALSSHNYQGTITATMQNLMSDAIDFENLNRWICYFASCCLFAAAEVERFQNRSQDLRSDWDSIINPRVDSATNILMNALPGIPVFSAETAAQYIDRSYKRTNSAISELLEKGIITQITKGKRNRVFECPDVINLYGEITGL